jgi:hypothetical protein
MFSACLAGFSLFMAPLSASRVAVISFSRNSDQANAVPRSRDIGAHHPPRRGDDSSFRGTHTLAERRAPSHVASASGRRTGNQTRRRPLHAPRIKSK